MPTVSILLPTYKEAPYILRSLKSVLEQSFFDWELIIIDDGLTVSAKQIIFDFTFKDKRIKLHSNPKNLGLQKSLNQGLALAKGRYIARIDDDDIWTDKDKLKSQIEFLINNPQHVLIGTGAVVLNTKEKELFRYLFPEHDKEIRNKILIKDCFVHSSVIFDREVALFFGGYSEAETVKHIEDYDLWLKLGTRGKFYNLPTYATAITHHPQSISYINKLVAFKRMIPLITRFKDKYPNYFVAKILAYARFSVYFTMMKLPIKNMHQRLLKFYRKNF